MRGASILLLFIVFTVCNFCGQDFVSINRHKWRCKHKLGATQDQRNHGDESNIPAENINVNQIPSNTNTTKCICGKECKGLRGLKTHQRTCRSIKLASDEVINDDVNAYVNNAQIEEAVDNANRVVENPDLKAGIKLPRSDNDWTLANAYFHSMLSSVVVESNLDEAVNTLHSIVYDYFKDNYGYKDNTSTSDDIYKDRYKAFNKNQLKRELKRLKASNDSDANAIRFVSKFLRSKVNKSKIDIVTSTDNDVEIAKNFWSYAKKVLVDPKQVLPTFSKSVCTDYFKKTFKCLNPRKEFTIPSWIPRLKNPEKEFDMSSPSYGRICKIIKRMKASASPCPLDQVSIICFKRCPYLRTYMSFICAEVFRTKVIPKAWARATTILIYKKGETDNPENFRPITLEPVTLKIFTSLLRNRVFEYLMANKYIECHYQKGFTPGMSGTFEHIGEMSYLINQARLKQRSLCITLIDLRNAFGEVNHNLIHSVLKYHHVPDDVCAIVSNLYMDFHLAIMTKDFITEFIPMKKGVLQGDCFSPLCFNLIINTFIQSILEDQYTIFGFAINDGFKPRNWFQFADDAAAVTCLERENQFLLNVFNRWCNWADMIVRVDKCYSFGIKKKQSRAIQYKPKLYLNNLLIKTVDLDESFTYLGRHFDFNMTNDKHKSELLDTINEQLSSIDRLPLHPKNKILLYQRFILSKVSWHLTVANLSITWVKNNVDNLVAKHIRSWLEIPISGTLDILQLTKRKFGIGIILPSSRFTQCQVTFRNSLRTSKNPNIRSMHEATSIGTNIQYDKYVSTKEALKQIRSMKEDRIKGELKSQSLVITSIWDYSCSTFTNSWSNVLDKLPRNIYSFVVRYLSNSLANATNSLKWGNSSDSKCTFCGEAQTLGHVVGACKVSLNEKRYNWRHDSILSHIAKFLSKIQGLFVYCDIEAYLDPSIITGEEYRPDIVVKKGNKLVVIELTAGYETNIEKNGIRKNDKYKPLLKEIGKQYEIRYINLSMGAIGIIGEHAKNLKTIFSEIGVENSEINFIINRIINVCIRTTYYIFCKRNQKWDDPELLSW